MVNPDFVALAKAMHCHGIRCDSLADLPAKMDEFMRWPNDSPIVFDARVVRTEHVYPMVRALAPSCTKNFAHCALLHAGRSRKGSSRVHPPSVAQADHQKRYVNSSNSKLDNYFDRSVVYLGTFRRILCYFTPPSPCHIILQSQTAIPIFPDRLNFVAENPLLIPPSMSGHPAFAYSLFKQTDGSSIAYKVLGGEEKGISRTIRRN